MTRNLLLSNGRLLVNFDRHYHLRDLCRPHVGQEDHTEGHSFRFGIYSEDRFSWIAGDSWEKEIHDEDDTAMWDREENRFVRALPNGLRAEQIHPFMDEPLSACPLTWSHSTFVLAVHEYMTKCRELHCSARYLDYEKR